MRKAIICLFPLALDLTGCPEASSGGDDPTVDGLATPADAARDGGATSPDSAPATPDSGGSGLDGGLPVDAATTDGAVDRGATGDGAMSDALPQGDAAGDGPSVSRDGGDTDAARDGGAVPDAAVVLLCGPCVNDDDCAGLAEGAVCSDLIGSRGCLESCMQADECPRNFSCTFNRCIPAGARCESCAIAGCPEDERCNGFSGACEPRLDRCADCQVDEDCMQPMSCRQLGFARVCLDPCDGDECALGFACNDDDFCEPASGFCDPCGVCAGDRPVCNFITGECGECGGATACPDELICNPEGECVEPQQNQACFTGLDCRDPARPRCVEGQCIFCDSDISCAAGETCTDGLCVEGEDRCRGITCSVPGACDPETGVCDPACVNDEACGDPMVVACNGATGQCYRRDQRCEHDDTAVCAPGGVCVDDLFAEAGICTCARTDLGNLAEPNDEHRIPCQPGGVCLQFNLSPGTCIVAP